MSCSEITVPTNNAIYESLAFTIVTILFVVYYCTLINCSIILIFLK